jgi:hypothetical protein
MTTERLPPVGSVCKALFPPGFIGIHDLDIHLYLGPDLPLAYSELDLTGTKSARVLLAFVQDTCWRDCQPRNQR